jgi:hypothetical protein
VPSQRFEGLGSAAEAVVKSDRRIVNPGKIPGFFLLLVEQPALTSS